MILDFSILLCHDEAAWQDGKVSDDEENMLQNMRNALSITDSEHKTILGVARAKLN